MFLRSALTKCPRITHINHIRTCTNQITPPPVQSIESSSDWNAIYKLPSINFLAKLSKLKVYQSIVTSAGVPMAMGLESFQMVPSQTTELFAIIGITGTITLSVYSFWASNVIGFVYVNPVLRKIRFGYLDFWGRRRNVDLSLNEIVSSDLKKVLNTYAVVKTTTSAGSFKLLKYGTIMDSDMFFRLFGYI